MILLKEIIRIEDMRFRMMLIIQMKNLKTKITKKYRMMHTSSFLIKTIMTINKYQIKQPNQSNKILNSKQ